MDIDTTLQHANGLEAKAMDNVDGFDAQVRTGILISARELREKVFKARVAEVSGMVVR